MSFQNDLQCQNSQVATIKKIYFFLSNPKSPGIEDDFDHLHQNFNFENISSRNNKIYITIKIYSDNDK